VGKTTSESKKPLTADRASAAWDLYAGNQNVVDLNASYTLRQRRNVVNAGTATVALGKEQSGALVCFTAVTGAVTLPAISADDDDIGMFFDFICRVSSTSSQTVTAAAADLLEGGVWMVDFDAAYTAPQGIFLEPDATDDLIMTMNGTTTGGKIGTAFRVTATTAARWYVSGVVAGDGVLATPFS
jgi:hypothetical protein